MALFFSTPYTERKTTRFVLVDAINGTMYFFTFESKLGNQKRWAIE